MPISITVVASKIYCHPSASKESGASYWTLYGYSSFKTWSFPCWILIRSSYWQQITSFSNDLFTVGIVFAWGIVSGFDRKFSEIVSCKGKLRRFCLCLQIELCPRLNFAALKSKNVSQTRCISSLWFCWYLSLCCLLETLYLCQLYYWRCRWCPH
jgi:hypothetical protein